MFEWRQFATQNLCRNNFRWIWLVNFETSDVARDLTYIFNALKENILLNKIVRSDIILNQHFNKIFTFCVAVLRKRSTCIIAATDTDT